MTTHVPKVRMRRADQVQAGDKVFIDERWWLVDNVTLYGSILLFYAQHGVIWTGSENKRIKVKR